MKKLLSLLILAIMPLLASADNVKIEGVFYILNTEGATAEVTTNPDKYSGDITIPENVISGGKSYRVTSIGKRAFMDCVSLTSVTLPKRLTTIGLEAFSGCVSLTAITIPSIVSLGKSAFKDCSSLTTVTCDMNSPTYLWDGDTFTNRFNATLFVPKGCVEAYANYSYWKDFKEIKEMVALDQSPKRTIHVAKAGTLLNLIPIAEKYYIEDLKLTGELNGDDIFLIRWMAGINPDIMNDYKYLGKSALTTGKLRVLDLSDANIVKGGGEYYKEKVGSESFGSYIYTSNDEISACMFTYCSKLEELVLPKSAKVISPRMMYGDASDRPQMNIKVLKVADGNSNYDSRDNCNAIIETATNTLVVGCNGSTIPDGVTSIGDYAFADCSGMTSAIIPNSVTTIGDYAFYNCSSLTSVIIPSSVTSISEFRAFYNCSGLESVTVHHTTPLAIYNGTFSWWDRDNYTDQKTSATLYVPVGTKTLYEAADGWKEFKSIIEDETIKGPAHKEGDTFTVDGVLYKVTSVDPLEVQIGNGNFQTPAIDKSTEGTLELPASVIGTDGNSYSVTSISMGAFAGCKGLTTVTIPNSVTTISGGMAIYNFGGAFDGCGLTSLFIPSSVTSIGGGAFGSCSNLTSIVVDESNTVYDSRNNCNAIIETNTNSLIAACNNTIIPNGITGIEKSAFSACREMTSIEIPNSVTWIGDFAFTGCSGLISLNIPNGVKSIGDSAFDGCSSLTSVTIPESVTTIWRYAFSGCSSLTSIVIPKSVQSLGKDPTSGRVQTILGGCNNLASIIVEDGNPKFDSRNNCNAIIETSTNTLLSGCNNTRIPNSVTAIGNEAFYASNGLLSIIIPSSVTSIGNSSFWNCNNLTSVTIDKEEPLAIGEYSFGNRANATLYVPEGCVDAYKAANVWKEFKEIKEIESPDYKMGDTFIVDGVTYKVTSIDPLEVQVGDGESWASSKETAAIDKSIEGAFEIPASVTAIDGNTYSVTSIARGAFISCSGLTSVTIPNSVTTIAGGFDFGGSAFVGGAFERSGLTSLTIPSSVTSIGDGAFSGCSNLISIIVEEGNTEYDSRDNCNAIIETSSNSLIAGCINTIIPDGVTRIGMCAFKNCKEMTSIEIPNSVTQISGYAFSGCSGLTSLTLPKNLTSIRVEAFSGCSGLTSIVIPEGVTKISAYAFYGCSSLTSISIPASVNSIGMNDYIGWYGMSSFYGCNNLTSVTVYREEPLAMGGSVLSNSANATLYVPKGCVDAYKAADYWKDFNEIKEFVEDESVAYIVEEEKTVAIKDVPGSTEKEVEIPQSVTIEGEEYAVTAIAESAFEGNTALEQVTIPATITSIGDGAFSGCTSLKAIYCYSEEPVALGSAKATVRTRANGEETSASTVFAEVDKETCILYVPKNSADKYRDADGWGEFKNIVEMDSEIPGDANNDGNIDQNDIEAIVNYIMTGDATGLILKNADMNGDEKIDAADIVLIVNKIK